jgi:hypothetical protein
MGRRRFVLTALITLLVGRLHASDLSDVYLSVVNIFGIDPNAGQNSFLVLVIPSGGLYEGMGTAFTAVTLNSGFMEANPAASAFLKETEFSFMHNNWIGDSSIETILFGVRRGNLGFGGGIKFLHLPFTGYNEWGGHLENDNGVFATGFYTETVAVLNCSYSFFRNYYFNGLALGGNFKIGYRGVSEALASGQSALSLMGDIGLLTQFNFLKFYASRDKNFNIGVNARNLGAEFIDNPDPLPSYFSAGISWSPIRPLTLAFDVNLPFNLNGEPSEMISYAAGMNVNLTSFLSLQTGFLIKTGKPRFSLGSSLALKNITLIVNYTLDMTTQFDLFDRMSLTLNISLGDLGRALARDTVQQLYLEGLELYAKGDLPGAIAVWGECLDMDPAFTPAQEMIETASKTLNLEQEMNTRQKVE